MGIDNNKNECKEKNGCLLLYLKYLLISIVVMSISYYSSGELEHLLQLERDKLIYLPLLIIPFSGVAFVIFIFSLMFRFIFYSIIKKESMNNFVSTVLASFIMIFAFGIEGDTYTSKNNKEVYICTGPKAKVYHKYKDCKGLRNCSGDIKAVSLEQAKKSRRACRICYK